MIGLSLISALAWADGLFLAGSEVYYDGLPLFLGDKMLGTYNWVATTDGAFATALNWSDDTRRAPSYTFWAANGSRVLPAVGPLAAAGAFGSGRAPVLLADREALYGYMGTNGRWAIQPRFVEAEPFLDGYALAREPGGTWGVIDVSGAWVARPSWTSATNLGYGFILAESGSRSVFDAKSAKVVIQATEIQVTVHEGLTPGKSILIFLARVSGKPDVLLGSDGGDLLPLVSKDQLAFKGVPFPVSYRIGTTRYGDIEYDEYGLLTYSKVEALRPDGTQASPFVFNKIGQFHGSVALVGFGNAYPRSGRNGTVGYEYMASSSSEGVVGLYDFEAKRFLVDPNCSLIQRIGPGRYYVLPIEGPAFLADQTGAKISEAVPGLRPTWIRGPFYCCTQSSGEEMEAMGLINNMAVRVRSGPGTDSAVVTQVDKGTRVTVRQVDPRVVSVAQWTGAWLLLDILDKDGRTAYTGWVLSEFVEFAYYDGP